MFEFGEAKSWIALLGGLLFTIVGILLALMSSGILKLPIPELPLMAVIAIVIIASLLLIYNGFMEMGMHFSIGLFSMIVGVVALALSVSVILSSFGFIPVDVSFIGVLVFDIILAIIGILLFVGAFMF